MRPVTIVLVNFNGLMDIESSLESIKKQDYENIELIAIDNRSSDGSLDVLREFAETPENRLRFAGASPLLISNADNIGFSPALNQGIRQAGGDYIVSMNTDVVLEPGFISSLVQTMRGFKVGSATGKLLRFPPGGEDSIIDSTGHIIFKNRLAENRGEGKLAATSFLQPEPVFGVCGGAAMYSREMLEDVVIDGEYFDESFFAFWEDLDLDWRANLRGWICMYDPDAVAYHRRGGAGYRKSLLVEYHNYKNRYLTVMKNDSLRYVLWNLPGIILTEVLKGGALLIRCPRALLSIFEVLKLMPSMLKKRRVIQSRRVVPAFEMEKWFQPFDYRKWIRRHLFNRGEMIIEGEESRL